MKLLIKNIFVVRELLGKSFVKYLSIYPLAILSAMLELLGVGIIFPLVAVVLAGPVSMDGLPSFMRNLFVPLANQLELKGLCVLLIAIFVLRNVTTFFIKFYNARMLQHIRAEWMMFLFKRYIHAHYGYFLQTRHGDVLYNLFDLPRQACATLRMLLLTFLKASTLIIMLLCMLALSWQLTLVLFVIIVVAHYVVNVSILRKAVKYGEEKIFWHKMMLSMPSEVIKGLREIKAYTNESQVVKTYKKITDSLIAVLLGENKYKLLPTVFPDILMVIGFSVVMVSLDLLYTGEIAGLLPIMATYYFASQRVFYNAGGLLDSIVRLGNQWPSLTQLVDVMHRQIPEDVASGSCPVERSVHTLECKNLSFNYGNEEVLTNVSVAITRGQIVAIVGESGSGKSTLVDLLMRLYEPTGGSIVCDNRDIKNYNIFQWRGQIRFAGQNGFLFNGSVRENIAFGSMHPVSHDDLIRAAHKADVVTFVDDMPNGYDTVIGEHGAMVSGGQRQRIALARAFLEWAPILVMDEATCALDAHAERRIMEQVRCDKDDRITIVISHRLSSLVMADRILVLKNGAICEDGSHDDLLKQNGEYARLYSAYVHNEKECVENE